MLTPNDDGIKTCKCLKGHCAHYQSDFDSFVKDSALPTPQKERDTKTELWYILGDVNPDDIKIERLESYITAREAELLEQVRNEIENKQDLETMYDHVDTNGKRRRCVFLDDIIDVFAAREIRNSK